MAASDENQVRQAIDAAKSGWLGAPRIVAIQYELGADLLGDPSVYVTVVLDEATQDRDWVSQKLDPIEQLIKSSVAQSGSDRWVYVRFIRPSELKAAG